jgi:hypothetical protein
MSKGLMMLSITICGGIGSYIPVILWHAGGLSGWSIIGGLIGSIAGIWVAFKLNEYI